MKYASIVIALLYVVGLISCKQKAETKQERPAVTVDILIAKKVSFPASVEVNGTALSEEMIELHPEVSGRLTYLNIPDGAKVSQGTVLARVNDADLQAQLQQQKVQLELAAKTEARLRKLLEINGVNQSEYDAALTQLNMINANISVLNAQIDKTIIKAPFSGTLGLRMVSPGAYVSPQTLLGTLNQTDKIKIDFTVPETYRELLSIGVAVEIQSGNNQDKETAVISAIEPQINQDTRNIKVRARMKSPTVSPGSFVKVIIDKSSQGIIVPSNSIIPDATSNQVIVVKNKKAVFTNVETGLRNEDAVELISGVNPGDSIIVSGVLFVRANAIVKIGKIVDFNKEGNSESKQIVK